MKISEELDIEKKYKSKRIYRAGFKQMILEELVVCRESVSFIARKHGIADHTVYTFKHEALDQLGYFRILNDMKGGDKSKKDTSALEKENEELKRALELAMLKVSALETLVDVAEDQFNIQIRKKPGAKQSK